MNIYILDKPDDDDGEFTYYDLFDPGEFNYLYTRESLPSPSDINNAMDALGCSINISSQATHTRSVYSIKYIFEKQKNWALGS